MSGLTEAEEELLLEAQVAWDSGQVERAAQIIESYLARHPERKEALLAARASRADDAPPTPFADLACLRCAAMTYYSGRLHLREGRTAWGFWLGDVGELLENREAFDVYRCRACGHVEFFTPDATRKPDV